MIIQDSTCAVRGTNNDSHDDQSNRQWSRHRDVVQNTGGGEGKGWGSREKGGSEDDMPKSDTRTAKVEIHSTGTVFDVLVGRVFTGHFVFRRVTSRNSRNDTLAIFAGFFVGHGMEIGIIKRSKQEIYASSFIVKP